MSDQSYSKSVREQLADLREITRLTGTVDDLQAHNLTLWGKVAFHGIVKSFGLFWNGDDRSVEYELQGLPAGAVIAERFYLALDTSIKDLLGREWSVTVKDKDTGSVLFTRAGKDIIAVDPKAEGQLLKHPFRTTTGSPLLAPEHGELGPEAEDGS